MIPYGRQSITEEDIAAVAETLRSDFLTTGPTVARFEEAAASVVGAKHAIACSSGTAALHLAMLACKIGPGDRSITSPNTFLASANCAAFVGATPAFSDIDAATGNLDPALLESNWTDNTKAVIAVDFAGQPCNMPEIARIARERGAYVIEDACHSFGGALVHDGETHLVGGHPWADLTMFSFHPVKNFTTGEGGMLTTNDDALADRIRSYRNHGFTNDPSRFEYFGQDGDDPLSEAGKWSYEMHDLGYNYRITDFQCALGLSQLKRIPDFLERRRAIVAAYNAAFADVPTIQGPTLDPAVAQPEHIAWHLYAVLIDFPALGTTRAAFTDQLRELGVGTQVHYIPVHLQPYYRKNFGFKPGDFPQAEARYQQSLSLPLYPSMTDAEVETVIGAVKSLL